MAAARTLLVGDDPLARAGVALLLSGAPEVELVGSGSLDETPALLAATGPEVVLWDSGGAEDSVAALVAAAGEVPVLALFKASGRPGGLWRAGVRGLLERGAGAAPLVAALVATARGLAVLEPGLAGAWLRVPPTPDDEGPDALTPREQEVLDLLAEGLGNKAIAGRLGVSDHTAKFHVNAILQKLGAGTRAEAIVRAARRGLVVL
jgi:DNA-binding NarL/FixJ family response regulator